MQKNQTIYNVYGSSSQIVLLLHKFFSGPKKLNNLSYTLQNFEILIFDSIKLIILIIIDKDKQESKWHDDFQYFG